LVAVDMRVESGPRSSWLFLSASLAAVTISWVSARRKLAEAREELGQSRGEVARLRAELGWVKRRAAHDLLNPLTPIVARAEMLRRSLERPDQQRQAEGILRAACRMGRMIEDLRDRAASAG
jgi:signal transduction histidine kinase